MEQKEVLVRSGFSNVVFGGLPFVYVKKSGVSQKKAIIVGHAYPLLAIFGL